MNYRTNIYFISAFLITVAILLTVPLFIAVFCGEPTWLAFLITIVIFAALGIPFVIKKPKDMKLAARDGFFIVAFGWLIISLIGALPFYISGALPSYIDAFFETVSGLTTTGSTVFADVENLPYSLLYWRSFTQWIGGMGVLVFFLAVLPKSAKYSIHIFHAESSMSQDIQIMTKVRYSARVLYGIYFGLTAAEIVLLLCGGMNFFDALLTSFTTAGTGGFSPKNASIAAYGSVYCEIVISVFMLLFSLNFNLFFLILMKKFLQAFRNEEFLWFLSIVGISIVAITISLSVTKTYATIWESLRYSSFVVSSIISTTGYYLADYTTWPLFTQYVLFFLMFVGGCAGSSAGGLKVSRIIILVKGSYRELRKTVNPRKIFYVRSDGKPVDEGLISAVFGYFVMYVGVFALSMILISLGGKIGTDSIAFVDAVSAVTTALNNVGPAFGSIGAFGYFGNMSVFAKLVLSFDMLAGRLEILPLVLMFYPKTWRKF